MTLTLLKRYWRPLLGVILFASLITGYNLWIDHQQDIREAQITTKYEGILAEKEAAATQALMDETALVMAKDAELQKSKNLQEITDAKNARVVAGLKSKLRDLGMLRDPGYQGQGSSSPGNPGPGANGGADDGAQGTGLLSAEASDLLRELTEEADLINLAYISCRADSFSLREILGNPGDPKDD